MGSAVGEGCLSFGSREIRKRKLQSADELDTKKRKCIGAMDEEFGARNRSEEEFGASKGIWRGAVADPAKQRLRRTMDRTSSHLAKTTDMSSLFHETCNGLTLTVSLLSLFSL